MYTFLLTAHSNQDHRHKYTLLLGVVSDYVIAAANLRIGEILSFGYRYN